MKIKKRKIKYKEEINNLKEEIEKLKIEKKETINKNLNRYKKI